MMSFLKEAAARLEKPAPLSAIILAWATSVAAWLAVLASEAPFRAYLSQG